MATFLIDYENVFAHVGLKGAEFLNENDKVYFFYSQACPSIRKDEMDAILNSKCDFKVCKLIRAYKNGLDFYIASEAGALAENGEKQIAIISNDTGFNAVLDYLKYKYTSNEFWACKAPSIEKAITTLNASCDVDRRAELQNRMFTLDLGQEYAKYKERNQFKEQIKHALIGTDYEEKTDAVISYVSESRLLGKRIVYTNALRKFGKNEGVEIYRLIRDAI